MQTPSITQGLQNAIEELDTLIAKLQRIAEMAKASLNTA